MKPDTLIDSSMRKVRVMKCAINGEDYYTTESGDLIPGGNMICNHCGKAAANICKTYKLVLKSDDICLKVQACPEFQPILGFRAPIIGIDGKFTTFRVGAAWSKRVSPGMTVALYDDNAKKLIGNACVTFVDSNLLPLMLEKYAHLNHSQLALSPEGAPERLRGRLMKLYGPRVLSDNKVVTVIGLEREAVKSESEDRRARDRRA